MISRIERIVIMLVAVFIAVSAVAGGVGLVGGGLPFPLEWLAGTPFSDYTIPAAILAIVVGGSALVAAALMLLKHPLAVLASLGAGMIQVGWIIGELLLVGTIGDVMMWLQVIYFVSGAIIAVLAAHLWLKLQQSGRVLSGARSTHS
ncbi:MAG: hypothetical protein ACYC1C_11225 [Chloroflexota bacterium]